MPQRAPDDVVDLVNRVQALPYGRPSERTVRGMLAEGRGTCSTKHRHLHEVLSERHPELRPALVHRVYSLDREGARRRFGDDAAALVPEAGLTDVHRYLTIELGGERVAIDATFPGRPWDGRSSMPVAAAPGQEEVCAGDPDVRKRELEALHCDPAVREPFIAALAERPSG